MHSHVYGFFASEFWLPLFTLRMSLSSSSFFGFFALSIVPHGFLSLLQPPASDCSPDINTLEGGVTAIPRVSLS